ncbi:MAG: hypothetical protein RL757_1199, partial [Bacteroidota bacterium]
MKKSLFSIFCFLLSSSSLMAQITINRANFAISGSRDSAAVKRLTQAGATLPTIGNNQTWDYSAQKDSFPNVSRYYYEPVASFGAVPPLFSDATYAFNYLTTFQFFAYPSRAYEKLDATGYAQLGYITQGGKFSLTQISGGATDSIYFSAGAQRYANPWISYKFPMTANSVWKSNYKDTSNFQLSIAAFGLNRTPGFRVAKYNYTDSIVGWGTLKLRNPSGGAPLNFAVLLQQSSGTQVDSFYLGGAPAPATLLAAFGLTQGQISVGAGSYQFLGVGFNAAFLSVFPSNTGGVGSLVRAVIPSVGLTLDNKEIKDNTIVATLYPNPTTSGINLEFQKSNAADWNVMIYNEAGQIIAIQR